MDRMRFPIEKKSEGLPVVVLATPHGRYDLLEKKLRDSGIGEIVRIFQQDELLIERLIDLRARYVFFPHWSWKIPDHIFNQIECILFHMTDLPYGRGGSPLQNLIVRGHQNTILSAIRCVSEMDAGPVYLKKPLKLMGTAEEILQNSSQLMLEMMIEIVKHPRDPTPQQGTIVSFKRRGPEKSNLKELNTLLSAYDTIRMLDADGYPKAFLETAALKFEFTQAFLNGDCVEAKVRIAQRV